jgi:replicative DNA helicase
MTETRLFDTENEVAFLSILINNPDKIYAVTKVKSFMLGSTVNQILLQTMQEMVNQNLLPEVNLLINTLGTKGSLVTIGGLDYLTYLKNMYYPLENLVQYESLICDSYSAKRLIELGGTLTSLTTSQNADISKVIESSRIVLDNLETSVSGEQTVDFSSALQDGWKEIVRRIETPGATGIATGIEDLDIATGGGSVGKVWLWAGRPSQGKSADACNVVLHAASNGIPCLFHSLEMSRVDLVERFLGIKTGIDISDIHLGLLDQHKMDLISKTIDEIQNYPIYIDTNFSSGLSYITSTIRKYVKQKGVKVVFLDYIQLLAVRDGNATGELGQISREMKLLANELEIWINILSQLNRLVEGREDRRPLMSDLRQCGNLEEDADIIIMLYRDEYYNRETKHKGLLEHIIRKNRQTGILGAIVNKFNYRTNKVTKKD